MGQNETNESTSGFGGNSPGEETVIVDRNGRRIVGIKLPQPDHAHLVPGHNFPVVLVEASKCAIPLKSRQPITARMLLTELSSDECRLSRGQLAELAARLWSSTKPGSDSQFATCAGVEFPACNVNDDSPTDSPVGIAPETIKMKMEPAGARPKEAASMAAAFERFPAKPVVIRGAFLMAVILEVDGLERLWYVTPVDPSNFVEVKESMPTQPKGSNPHADEYSILVLPESARRGPCSAWVRELVESSGEPPTVCILGLDSHLMLPLDDMSAEQLAELRRKLGADLK